MEQMTKEKEKRKTNKKMIKTIKSPKKETLNLQAHLKGCHFTSKDAIEMRLEPK